jgi:autotransporter-associated beta strand protein
VVSLNGSRTIGALVFGDRTPDYDWVLAPGTGGTLTLAAASGAPVIAVSNRTATVAVTLAGTNGFVKTGAGTLNLAAINTYQGPTVVAEGTLNVLPMPYGVVAAYGFDDASNLGLDSSSQSNALKTSQGAPQYSAGGKFGGALYLNGSSLLRTSSGLFPSGVPTGAAPYTVSAYIKAAPTCALTGGWIGYGNNASNRCNNYRLNGTNTSVQNYWYYNDMTASLPSGSFTDGWHSVVGTWNGTDQALYLDGVKQAQRTPATKVNVGTNDFVVGRTTADANFTGWVDEVLIGNRAFTPEEIASLNAVGIRASTLLPAATAVRVAAVATLNLNGMSQTVAGLSGSGSVTNVATLTVSGTLTPGDSSVAPAFLTVSSNLTLAAGATLAFDYTATTSDSVRVTGTLAVQGTNTVVLSGIGSVQPPSRITLFTFGALTGLENLASWSVQGVGLAGKQVRVRSDATSVHVTITPSGTLIRVL